MAFEQALDVGRPAEALELYHGDFFQAVFVADGAPEFDQWVDGIRRGLRERAVTAAGALAAASLAADDLANARRWADLACRAAPEDETSVRQLMRVLGRAGDRAAALRAYERFARRMAEELGAEPATETQALAERLGAGSAAPAVEAEPGLVLAFPPDTTPLAAGGDPSNDPTDDVMAAPVPTHRPRRRRRGVLAALVMLAAITTGVFAPPWHRAVLGPSDRLIIADFRNQPATR